MASSKIYHLLGVLLSVVVLVIPATVAAQEGTPATPDLIVSVHDLNGSPLPGLLVQLRTAGSPPLAQARTDAEGQASFTNIRVSQVRVELTGILPTGVPLRQPGDDAAGIAVFLGPPPTRLDLLIDADGTVLPDLSTMLDPVPNGPALGLPAPDPAGEGGLIFPTSATYIPHIAATAAAEAALPIIAPSDSTSRSSAAASQTTLATLLTWLPAVFSVVASVGGILLVVTALRRRQS